MKVGQYMSQLSCMQQQKRLDVIANNIANVNTPGFKRDLVAFANVMEQASHTEWNQGDTRETGNPLDVALQGEGFLRVQSGDEVLFTRAGSLTVGKEGALITTQGYPVLGPNGPIQVKGPNVQITEDGQIFDEQKQIIGQIDIVKFPKDVRLQKVTHGCFKPEGAEVKPEKAESCTLKQGALESANFNLVEEMTRMVDSLRMFEAYQKSIDTSNKDLDGQIISKLGTT